ncbi:MAG: TPM domain-containing protein [Fimbriimonadia bacterium]|nr:TPM domain-containing protein [Fimbriimonadia bacterium]
MKKLSLWLCLLMLWGIGWTDNPNDVPNPRKQHGGWVTDRADVIPDKDELEINRLLEELERETGAEMAVVTIKSSSKLTPKDFATELFNLWGIGKKEKDNGVLMLLVLDARRVEVETGYGVEGALPDAVVGEILRKQAVPEFKAGRFGKGLKLAAQEMVESLKTDPDVFTKPRIRPAVPSAGFSTGDSSRRPVPSAQSPILPPPRSPGVPGNAPSSSSPALLFIVPIVVVGGLAGIGFLIYYSTRPPTCPTCQQYMRLLSEQQDDAYLNAVQQLEERIKSVDYQAWRCDTCAFLLIKKVKRWWSGYEDCPRCKNRTLHVNRYTLREPTYTRSGLEQTDYTCVTPGCGYTDQHTRDLPRRQRSVDWSDNDNRRSGGGWIGGGWSGGGSSSSGDSGWSGGGSSSSEGGSFGGGSSGGGGAGASW